MIFVLAKLLILPVKQECQSESDFSYKHSFVRFLMDSSKNQYYACPWENASHSNFQKKLSKESTFFDFLIPIYNVKKI